jgi:hypothetical protein
MTWALVFWLSVPTNFVIHTNFSTEKECIAEQAKWTKRFNEVKSQLIAECRKYE